LNVSFSQEVENDWKLSDREMGVKVEIDKLADSQKGKRKSKSKTYFVTLM